MPNLADPLGPPKIVTGPEYMDALSKLGYNVENMSSPLPTMTKIAEAGTNFLDSIYNQNIKAQQSQADLQYKLAETKNVNAVADYNSRSLDLRLAELDTQNRQREQQISSAQREQPLREKILQNQGKTGDLDFQILQRKNDDFTQAQDALPGALQTLPDPEKDPNFKTNFDNWQSTYAGLLARQDSIGDQARRMRDTAKTRYEGTSRFHQNLADIQEFEGYQGKGTISKVYDPDKMVFGNPDQAQSLLVQGRALDAQSELQEILYDPRVPQAYKDKLDDAYTYVHNFVTSDTGAQDILKGKASKYFNPDGRLNSTARAMIDGVKALRETKPLEATARLPIPSLTGRVGKGETPYEDIKGTETEIQQRIIEQRAQQAAEQQRAAEMQDVPDTPENLVDKAAHQRNEISLEELHRRVNERMKTKPSTLPGNRRIPGMQAGGLVQALQPGGLVSGAPGPDNVPAMLTRGEYVVNKDAVQDVGLATLEALNAGTQQDPKLALNAGTQQDVQFQQPTQSSAFQQLFGQGSTDAPASTQRVSNAPLFPPLPTIRPQLAQTSTPAPRAMPAQTPAPRAQLAQTPAVTTGAATSPIASTGGTTLTPQYTTGDALLNAHYLGDGRLSGLATNFGHDVNGRPDTYMLSKLGGGSRIGAFGTDVVNPNTAGASIPIQTFRAFIGNPNDPQIRQRVQSGRVGVEVWAPNGRSAKFPIVDLGPGKGENASLDLTGSAMRRLGVSDNFGAVYRIYSE